MFNKPINDLKSAFDNKFNNGNSFYRKNLPLEID